MPPTQYSVIGYNGRHGPARPVVADCLGLGFDCSRLYRCCWRFTPGCGYRRLLPAREPCSGFTLAVPAAAANQFGRLQFNSGVRYVVPAVPFLFLLAAGPLLRLPRVIGWAVAALGTYWSWCLAMYRDVEQGLGVLESLIHITTEGVRLPWLVTLERLGFIGDARLYSVLLLGLAAAGLALLWGIRLRPRPALAQAQTGQSG